jgi:hypothetical protein
LVTVQISSCVVVSVLVLVCPGPVTVAVTVEGGAVSFLVDTMVSKQVVVVGTVTVYFCSFVDVMVSKQVVVVGTVTVNFWVSVMVVGLTIVVETVSVQVVFSTWVVVTVQVSVSF